MKKRKLILSLTKADFSMQSFKAGGAGGQNQNKRNTGVRITHKASGAVGEARDSRSQKTNKRNALKRLAETGKFKMWLNRKLLEIETNESVDDVVERMMQSKNIKTEFVDESGKWKLVE